MIKSAILFSALFICSLSCSAQKKSNSKSITQVSPTLDTIKVVDTLFITNSSTPFREKPNIDSKEWKEIPSYVVLVSHKRIGNYYEVLLNDTTGYIPIAFVNKYKLEPFGVYSASDTESSSSGVVSSPNSGSTYPSNTSSSSSRTSTSSSSSTYITPSKGCSSSQCSGRTKKGARCRNMTTSCSGRCYLH